MSKTYIHFSSLFYSCMMFGSVPISFRCAFLRGIECFLLRKNLKFCQSDTWKTIHDDDAFRYVTCRRLWRHNCFSNSIQFELIYFISIWTSQTLLKIRTFLCVRKRNELFDHPSYIYIDVLSRADYQGTNLPNIKALGIEIIILCII